MLALIYFKKSGEVKTWMRDHYSLKRYSFYKYLLTMCHVHNLSESVIFLC